MSFLLGKTIVFAFCRISFELLSILLVITKHKIVVNIRFAQTCPYPSFGVIWRRSLEVRNGRLRHMTRSRQCIMLCPKFALWSCNLYNAISEEFSTKSVETAHAPNNYNSMALSCNLPFSKCGRNVHCTKLV